jgi:lysophospholipase L1-like esterase
MALGDSITHGFIATQPLNQVSGYRGLLYTRLTTAGYSVNFVGSLISGEPGLADKDHEGHDGFRIDNLDAGVGTWLAANSPDLILLMAGTNDAAQMLPGCGARMASLLDHINQAAPQAMVLVSTIPPIDPGNLDAGGPERARAAQVCNAELPLAINSRAADGHNVKLVNAGGSLSVRDLADGIHPTPAGYTRLADAWYREIVPYVSSTLVCNPRPPVAVTTLPTGAGVLRVTVTVSGAGNAISGVAFGQRANVQPVTDLATMETTAAFTAHRTAPGPTHLAFTVTDGCGPWPSFAGGGPNAY